MIQQRTCFSMVPLQTLISLYRKARGRNTRKQLGKKLCRYYGIKKKPRKIQYYPKVSGGPVFIKTRQKSTGTNQIEEWMFASTIQTKTSIVNLLKIIIIFTYLLPYVASLKFVTNQSVVLQSAASLIYFAFQSQIFIDIYLYSLQYYIFVSVTVLDLAWSVAMLKI